MKYLIAAEGESLDSTVSSHFGKAPFFMTYDDETTTLDVKSNDGAVDPHLVIRDAAKAGVKKMICGGIGPHAFQVAEKFNVEVNIANGMCVSDTVKLAGEGKLPVATEPTPHHGQHGYHHHPI